MRRRSARWILLWPLLALAPPAFHGPAAGFEPPAADAVIGERRACMAQLGAALRAAWEKFDRGELATLDHEARRIADDAARIPELFPPGSFGEASRARATIAGSEAEFSRLSAALETTARALADDVRTADPDALRARLFAVGAACQACHRKFVDPPR